MVGAKDSFWLSDAGLKRQRVKKKRVQGAIRTCASSALLGVVFLVERQQVFIVNLRIKWRIVSSEM